MKISRLSLLLDLLIRFTLLELNDRPAVNESSEKDLTACSFFECLDWFRSLEIDF